MKTINRLVTWLTLVGVAVSLALVHPAAASTDTATIGDRVWSDTNNNGVQEFNSEGQPIEPGIGGVKVELYTCAGILVDTTTTLDNGFYYFLLVPNAEYYLKFYAPAGYVFSPQDHDLYGVDDTDSDADPATGRTRCTSVPGGIADGRWDAGLYMLVSPGTGTPGYWKTHPEAWPVDVIEIGGATYTKDYAIALMNMPDGDKTFTLFRALVSAKLNVMIGNNASCIAATITTADGWMSSYGPPGSNVKGNSDAWKAGEPLYWQLDSYNNGLLCAPHRN